MGAAVPSITLTACEPAADAPSASDADDISGVVTGANGPEAGVWVIAETLDLPTRFARIVVTDGEGRYLIPDLPEASYDVWVRGYGLVDSEKVGVSPGADLDLTAVSGARRPGSGGVLSRRGTGCRCFTCRKSTSSREPVTTATGSRRTSSTRRSSCGS